MNYCNPRKGVTMLEVIMVTICFAIAMTPVIGIYSMSVDNVKNIETRSLVYACSSELIDQIQTIDISGQEGGKFLNFLPEGGFSDFLSDEQHKRQIDYSSTPENFVRAIEIPVSGDEKVIYTVITVVEGNPPFSFAWTKERSKKRGGR